MKKKPVIFYNPIDGSAPVTIYWYDGPKGDAVEASKGDGVGFFGPSEDLLGVIFDDVEGTEDRQELMFSNGAKVAIKSSKSKIKILEVIEVAKRKDSA